MLTITLSTPTFWFILIFCCGLSFFAGCCWMAIGRKNKSADFDERDMYRDGKVKKFFSK